MSNLQFGTVFVEESFFWLFLHLSTEVLWGIWLYHNMILVITLRWELFSRKHFSQTVSYLDSILYSVFKSLLKPLKQWNFLVVVSLSTESTYLQKPTTIDSQHFRPTLPPRRYSYNVKSLQTITFNLLTVSYQIGLTPLLSLSPFRLRLASIEDFMSGNVYGINYSHAPRFWSFLFFRVPWKISRPISSWYCRSFCFHLFSHTYRLF